MNTSQTRLSTAGLCRHINFLGLRIPDSKRPLHAGVLKPENLTYAFYIPRGSRYLSPYIYIYIYMYVYLCVFIHVYIHTHIYIYTHVYTHICIYSTGLGFRVYTWGPELFLCRYLGAEVPGPFGSMYASDVQTWLYCL